MCLGIPMRITAMNGHAARCESRGIEREVSLFLLPVGSVKIGDFVMVHVGYAIERVDPQAARERRALVAEMQDSDA